MENIPQNNSESKSEVRKKYHKGYKTEIRQDSPYFCPASPYHNHIFNPLNSSGNIIMDGNKHIILYFYCQFCLKVTRKTVVLGEHNSGGVDVKKAS